MSIRYYPSELVIKDHRIVRFCFILGYFIENGCWRKLNTQLSNKLVDFNFYTPATKLGGGDGVILELGCLSVYPSSLSVDAMVAGL
jgi:hypothetical protein